MNHHSELVEYYKKEYLKRIKEDLKKMGISVNISNIRKVASNYIKEILIKETKLGKTFYNDLN